MDIMARADKLIEETQAAIKEPRKRRGIEEDDDVGSPFLQLF